MILLLGRPSSRDFIRTVPALQHDPDRPEDLNTAGEDHIADECRYACMSRPYIAQQLVKPKSNHIVLMADAFGQVRYVRGGQDAEEEVVSLQDVVWAHVR